MDDLEVIERREKSPTISRQQLQQELSAAFFSNLNSEATSADFLYRFGGDDLLPKIVDAATDASSTALVTATDIIAFRNKPEDVIYMAQLLNCDTVCRAIDGYARNQAIDYIRTHNQIIPDQDREAVVRLLTETAKKMVDEITELEDVYSERDIYDISRTILMIDPTKRGEIVGNLGPNSSTSVDRLRNNLRNLLRYSEINRSVLWDEYPENLRNDENSSSGPSEYSSDEVYPGFPEWDTKPESVEFHPEPYSYSLDDSDHLYFYSNGLHINELGIGVQEVTVNGMTIVFGMDDRVANIDFTPYGNSYSQDTELFVLLKGYWGMKDFVACVEKLKESGKPFPNYLYGTTNRRMGEIAQRFGFAMTDYDVSWSEYDPGKTDPVTVLASTEDIIRIVKDLDTKKTKSGKTFAQALEERVRRKVEQSLRTAERDWTAQELHDKSLEIADFMSANPDIYGVAIAGEPVNNISLVVFVDDYIALDYAKVQAIRTGKYAQDTQEKEFAQRESLFPANSADFIPFPNQRSAFKNMLIDQNTQTRIPVDFIIMSSDPSAEFLRMATLASPDPFYLVNLMKNIRPYAVDQREFVGDQTFYDDKIMDRVNRHAYAAFEQRSEPLLKDPIVADYKKRRAGIFSK
jgi:hypothetical protein